MWRSIIYNSFGCNPRWNRASIYASTPPAHRDADLWTAPETQNRFQHLAATGDVECGREGGSITEGHSGARTERERERESSDRCSPATVHATERVGRSSVGLEAQFLIKVSLSRSSSTSNSRCCCWCGAIADEWCATQLLQLSCCYWHGRPTAKRLISFPCTTYSAHNHCTAAIITS